MHQYKKLQIWQEAIELVLDIYKITKSFPDEEKYNLSQQLKRASISVASNIAEGSGRNSAKEFIQFLSIANGSCLEVETQLIISQKLNYITEDKLQEADERLQKIQKMLFNFRENLKSKI